MKSPTVLIGATLVVVMVLLLAFMPSKQESSNLLIESTELSNSLKKIASELSRLKSIVESNDNARASVSVGDIRKELANVNPSEISSELTGIRSLLSELEKRMASINTSLGGTDSNVQEIANQLAELAKKLPGEVSVQQPEENQRSAQRREQVKTFISEKCKDMGALKAQMESFTQRMSSTNPGFFVCSYAINDFVSNDIRASGMWDGAKTRVIQNLLNGLGGEKVTTMDIGANVGWFTLVMASMGHKVIAFEPMASNWKLVAYSVCLNPGMAERVWLYPYGGHEKNQICGMISGDVNKGDGLSVCNDTGNTWFHSDQEDAGFHDGYQYGKRGTIEMIRIDEHVKEDIFLAKLDIEGFEIFALKGATNLFKNYNVKYMIAEFGPPLMRVMGVDPMEVLNWFHNNGFVIHEDNFDAPELTTDRFGDLIQRWHGQINDLYLTRRP